MWPQIGRPRFSASARIGVAAGVPHRDLHEIHFLAQGHRLRPAVEDPPDLARGQVAPGGLELRGRGRHRARHREEDRQRRLPRVGQHPLDARRVADVADLMAVAEDGRRPVEQRALRVGAGRHHRAFDMDVGVDQPRGDDAALRIVDRSLRSLGRLPGAGRLHRGDAPPLDPNLPVPENPLGVGREHPGARHDQIGRFTAHRHRRQRAAQLVVRSDGKAGQGHARI